MNDYRWSSADEAELLKRTQARMAYEDRVALAHFMLTAGPVAIAVAVITWDWTSMPATTWKNLDIGLPVLLGLVTLMIEIGVWWSFRNTEYTE